jgi:predicted O-linked N-acetylglucosamine transferase (SPINDLY family)
MSLNVNQALRKAKSLVKKGELVSAAQLYSAVLAQFPQNKEAASGLTALQQRGVRTNPSTSQTPQALMGEAVKLYETGRLEQALARGQKLAAQYSDDPVIHNFVGVVNSGLGRTEAAIANYARAIERKPDYAEVHFNLAVACQALGRVQEAIGHYQRAIKLEPRNAQAHYGLGIALRRIGRHDEAIASYTRTIELQPKHAGAYNNLGNILQFLGRHREAINSFSKSVQLDPNNAEAHCNLGHAFNELGQYREAIAAYTNALQARPTFDDARAKLIHLQAANCDWQAVATSADKIAGLGLSGETVGPFVMLSLEDAPERQRRRAELHAEHTFRHLQQLPVLAPPGRQPQPLRIGYFSADFHEHATMYLMIKLLELHDRDSFVIHAFSYGPDQDDNMGTRLKQAVDVYHDVRQLDEKAIAELARSEGIDIAVDLKGYTQHGRTGIFAFRAAPIQISYLGYPGTLGMPSMDYIIADRQVIPEQQRNNYTEQVIYLPDSYQVNDSEREIASQAPARSEAGLPESAFVFCCFNNSYKITAAEFDIWMRLLRQVEGSVLWLLRSNEEAVNNLRREAQSRGVDSDRLVFADREPLPEHLARHRLADLFLDTFNYNAHTTASDALWTGLPVVTKAGQGFAARVGASLLNAAGLPELVTHAEHEYEQLALDLALNPDRLRKLRERLASNRLQSHLFDTQRFTRHIEEAYRQAYRKYLAGEVPESISIPS